MTTAPWPVSTPGKWPDVVCGDISAQKNTSGRNFTCNRPTGHTGRHHWAWYDLGGRIRAVWDARTPAPATTSWEEIFSGQGPASVRQV